MNIIKSVSFSFSFLKKAFSIFKRTVKNCHGEGGIKRREGGAKTQSDLLVL